MPDARLTRTRIRAIAQRLRCNYPETKLSNRVDPLEEAIFIILTSQTDERKYLETWSAFRSAFPTMAEAASATEEQIADAIRSGGLGLWKAKCIKGLLRQTRERYGNYSLDPLASLGNADLEKELRKLDGIGVKGARCIMMYSFERSVFPVDTHCARVLKRLGARTPRSAIRTKTYADGIQGQVPADVCYWLHIDLVQHGRAVCTREPGCGECCLRDLCRFGKSVVSSK